MTVRYYLIASRVEALVASHLEPEAFGTYMAVGTKKLASGHVVFFEIDPAFATLTSHFRVADINERCAPHPDGSPKRSKYISVYRVMEHLPLSVFGSLHLTTPDGRVLKLTEAPYHEPDDDAGARLYQELCPLIPMVVSGLPPSKFGKAITNPANLVSVPRQFFADLRLDRDAQGRLARWLPYTDMAHIEDCVREVESGTSEKATKTVSRTPRSQGFFRTVRRGFFVADQTGLKFYPFPSRDHLEIHHAKWWHSASAQ